jgi:hypothetical protein
MINFFKESFAGNKHPLKVILAGILVLMILGLIITTLTTDSPVIVNNEGIKVPTKNYFLILIFKAPVVFWFYPALFKCANKNNTPKLWWLYKLIAIFLAINYVYQIFLAVITYFYY